MSLELGFFIPPVPPEPFIKMGLRAEEVGYDFITCDDHMIYPFGAPFDKGGQDYGIHEAWTAMTYLAGATRKISVSHMVLGRRGVARSSRRGVGSFSILWLETRELSICTASRGIERPLRVRHHG